MSLDRALCVNCHEAIYLGAFAHFRGFAKGQDDNGMVWFHSSTGGRHCRYETAEPAFGSVVDLGEVGE